MCRSRSWRWIRAHVEEPNKEQEKDDDESSDDDDARYKTKSGRMITRSARLMEEVSGIHLTAAEQLFYTNMLDNEIACVGAGLGGGFAHTSELHVKKYKPAMASADREKWIEAIEAEHKNLKKYGVFVHKHN